MVSARVVILLVGLALVAAHKGRSSESGESGEKGDGIKLCSGKNLGSNADKATACCKKVLGSFLGNSDAVKTCAKKFKESAAISIFGKFVMQNFLDLKEFLDFRAKSTLSGFGPSVALADCVFKSQSLMDASGNMNYTAAADVLAASVPAEWQNATKAAVAGCQASVDASNTTSITIGTTAVNTKPALLVQCVRAAMLASCPTSQAINSTSCMTTLTNMRMCRFRLPIYRRGG